MTLRSQLKLVRAYVETRSFTFEAFGEDEVEAVGLLNLAWLRHQRDTGATLTWEELSEDVWTQELRVGDVFRDHSERVLCDTLLDEEAREAPAKAWPCDRCGQPLDGAGWTVHPPEGERTWCSSCANVDPETGNSLPAEGASS